MLRRRYIISYCLIPAGRPSPREKCKLQECLKAVLGVVLWDIRSTVILIKEQALELENNQECVGDAGEENIGLVSADQKELI